jgi:hypothetical protein
MPRIKPLLSGLDFGGKRSGRRFPDVTPEIRVLRQEILLGRFQLFVGARVKHAHDSNILNSKQKRHARA